MPAGDRSGPAGMGPRTGRGMGYCAGWEAPGWANPGPGRGYYGRGGRGMRARGWGGYGPGYGGGGRGWRHWYHATGLPRWARGQGLPYGDVPAPWEYGPAYQPPSREQELEMLKDEAAWLGEQLDAISKRMDELSSE